MYYISCIEWRSNWILGQACMLITSQTQHPASYSCQSHLEIHRIFLGRSVSPSNSKSLINLEAAVCCVRWSTCSTFALSHPNTNLFVSATSFVSTDFPWAQFPMIFNKHDLHAFHLSFECTFVMFLFVIQKTWNLSVQFIML